MGHALGVDLLTDLPHPSCDPDRWTIQALLDELERRQEPESRHKLKPTKLAGKSLSELAVEARRRAEAKAALDKAYTKHWSRCAPCSPYPSPVCRTHSDMRASFQFPDPRELRLRRLPIDRTSCVVVVVLQIPYVRTSNMLSESADRGIRINSTGTDWTAWH